MSAPDNMEVYMQKLASTAVIALVLALSVQGLVGCGDPNGTEEENNDDPPEFDIEEVDDSDLMAVLEAKAECDAGWECPDSNREVTDELVHGEVGQFDSQQECAAHRAAEAVGDRSRDYRAAFEEGRVEVDRSRIEDCRDELRQRWCDNEPVDRIDITACMGEVELFSATQQDGDHCNLDFECDGDDTVCHSPPYGDCYGTCAPRDTDPDDLSDGQIPCRDDGCDEETEYCRYELVGEQEKPKGCEPVFEEGEECWLSGGASPSEPGGQCEGDLVCYDGECAESRQQGESCSRSHACEGDMFCHEGECQQPGQEGAECTQDHHCEGDLLCPGIGENECTPPGEEGDDCERTGDCLDDLTCRDDVCQPRQGEGEECETGLGCADGLTCVFGTCRGVGDGEVGDPCIRASNCQFDLHCSPEGTCVDIELRNEGETCALASPDCTDGVYDCHSDVVCEPGTRCWGEGFDEEFDGEKDGECIPVGQQDDPCRSHNDCAEGYHCGDELECQPIVDIGEPCEKNSGCSEGFCDTEKRECVEPLEDGEPCDRDLHCKGRCDLDWMNYAGVSPLGEIMGDGSCAGADGAPLCEVPDG